MSNESTKQTEPMPSERDVRDCAARSIALAHATGTITTPKQREGRRWSLDTDTDTDTAAAQRRYDELLARVRAANPVPPSFDHLRDPDLLQRLLLQMGGGDVPVLDTSGDAEPVERVKRRKRRPSLAGVARQAAKAGIPVAGYDVRPDGSIKVITGKPDEATTTNPWDEALADVTH